MSECCAHCIGKTAGHLMQSHQQAASELLAALDGTGLHPAQLMAWADARRIDYRAALKLPRLLKAVAEMVSGGAAPSSAAARSTAQGIRSLASSSGEASAAAARRADPLAALPAALRSLRLDWAEHIVSRADEAALRLRKAPVTAGSMPARDAETAARAARLALTQEQSLRGAALARLGIEQSWLGAAADSREPRAAELDAVARLLRQRGVPEAYISTWQRPAWFEMRRSAQQQWATQTAPGGPQAAGMPASLATTEAYAAELGNDSDAFERVVGQRLGARILYDQAAMAAGNGGVLRRAQLLQLAALPDTPERRQVSALATQTFLGKLAQSWDARSDAGSVSRPTQFAEFAEFAVSDAGRALFGTLGGSTAVPRRALLEAKTLDLTRGVDTLLRSPSASAADLASADVALTLLVAELPQGLADHAVERLRERLAAVDQRRSTAV